MAREEVPPMEPSAKGIVVVGVVEGLGSMATAKGVTEDALGARLSASALGVLEAKIELARWYPMGPFCELVEFEWELSGRDPHYERRAGARFADRTRETGLYQQVDYAATKSRPKSREELLHQSRRAVTVTSALFSFIRASVRISEAGDQLEMVYGNAATFPDPLRFLIEGYMTRVNEWQGSSRHWTSARPRPDEIVYSMALSSRLSAS
jgi:hypothetical protein